MLAAHGRLHTQQLFNDGRQYSEERRVRRVLLQYGQMAHKEPERSGDLLGCEIARERALALTRRLVMHHIVQLEEERLGER